MGASVTVTPGSRSSPGSTTCCRCCASALRRPRTPGCPGRLGQGPRGGRLLQAAPARAVGRLQSDPTTFYEAVRRIASACGSTGWVASHPRRAQLAPRRCSTSRPRRRCGARTRRPASRRRTRRWARARPSDGGYLVNGAWNWSSGCDHATWAFLGGPVIKDGKPGRLRQLPDPAHATTRSTTSGTSSGCAAPAATPRGQGRVRARHRSPSQSMNDRRCRAGDQHRAGVQDALGHRAPTTITAPIVGMAYGAYDAHVEHQGKRVRAAFAGREGQGRPVRQGPHRRGGQRHRRRLAAADRQHGAS